MGQDEREILLHKIAEANSKLRSTELELKAAKKKLADYEEMAQKAEQASRMKSLQRHSGFVACRGWRDFHQAEYDRPQRFVPQSSEYLQVPLFRTSPNGLERAQHEDHP